MGSVLWQCRWHGIAIGSSQLGPTNGPGTCEGWRAKFIFSSMRSKMGTVSIFGKIHIEADYAHINERLT